MVEAEPKLPDVYDLKPDVLLVGGVNNNNQILGTGELYNPTTGAFSLAGNLNEARGAQTAGLLNKKISANSASNTCTLGVESWRERRASKESIPEPETSRNIRPSNMQKSRCNGVNINGSETRVSDDISGRD